MMNRADRNDRHVPTATSLIAAARPARWLMAVAAGLAAACGGAQPPAAPGAATGASAVRAALTSTTKCVPANQTSCYQALHQETQPPPPPPHTGCTIQVMMEEVDVTAGQGISEGKLEISVVAEAGNGPVTWPESGDMEMKKGYPKAADVLVAEHALGPNDVRTINVCATFTEDDFGGVNGADDVGSDCDPVVIRCSMSPLTKTINADLCRGGDCTHLNGAMSAQFRISVSDEDQDGVANDHDYTPKPSDEACLGQLGTAIVLFIGYGSSNLPGIIQMIETSLDPAVTGFDFVAILAAPEVYDGLNNTPFSLTRGTIARADFVGPATLDGLKSAYRAATSRGYAITHYVVADGGTNGGVAYFTSDDPSGTISASTLAGALSPASTGSCAVPFVAVYSPASYMSLADDVWLNAGAKAVWGPTFIDVDPQFVTGVAAAWNAGQKFADAVGAGFDANVQNANYAAIEQAGTTPDCDPSLGASVLELNECSHQYFTGQNGPPELNFNADGRNDFNALLSGRDNLDAGAYGVVEGDPNVTRQSSLSW